VSQSKQIDREVMERQEEEMTPTVNRCGSTVEATQKLFTLQDISLLHSNRMEATQV
jgi:hypothetical protein